MSSSEDEDEGDEVIVTLGDAAIAARQGNVIRRQTDPNGTDLIELEEEVPGRADALVDNRSRRTSDRGPSYTQVEDLNVAKAFVIASECPLVGANQKGKVFHRKIATEFDKLMACQYELDKTTYQHLGSAGREAVTVPSPYPKRKDQALWNRWKGTISPRAGKFLATEEFVLSLEKSGLNDPATFKLLVKEHYAKRHPSLGDPRDVAEYAEYLRNKSKFHAWSKKEAATANDKRKKTLQRPMGNKRSKMMEQDKAIVSAAVKAATKHSAASVSSVSSSAANQQGKLYNMLEQIGSQFVSHMEKDAEEKMIASLPTPERKELRKEQALLLLAQTRAKRLNLEKKMREEEAVEVLGTLGDGAVHIDISSGAQSTSPITRTEE